MKIVLLSLGITLALIVAHYIGYYRGLYRGGEIFMDVLRDEVEKRKNKEQEDEV